MFHVIDVAPGVPGAGLPRLTPLDAASSRRRHRRPRWASVLAGLAIPLALVACEGSEIITPFEGIGDIKRDTSSGDGISPADSNQIDTGDSGTPDAGEDIPVVPDVGDLDVPPGDVADLDLVDLDLVDLDVLDLDVPINPDIGPGCLTVADCPTFGAPCATTTCVGGECVVVEIPDTTPCDDGDGCTISEECTGGECTAGLFICPCANDAACAPFNDGNLCNGTLTCTPEGCRVDQATVVLCQAPPSGSCEAVQCNGSTGACETVPANTGDVCSDPGPCGETRFCFQGECVATGLGACDDGNPCTVDSCSTVCVNTPVPNGAFCSDFDPCTAGDTCTAGTCAGTPGACPATCTVDVDCDAANDGNNCNGKVRCLGAPGAKTCAFDPTTIVSCTGIDVGPCETSYCNPANGQCLTAENVDGLACDDGDICTVGTTCDEGDCGGGQPLDCDDGNQCTTETCTAAGCVVTLASNSTDCDDGNSCTKTDKCKLGLCRPGNNSCNCTTSSDCATEPGFDACSGTPLCVGGKCELAPGSGPSCVPPGPCYTASCDAITGACTIALLPAGSACDDDNACSTASQCVAASCVGTAQTQCDDGNPCTNDTCNPTTGCAQTASISACTDDNACTVGDTCAGGACVAGQNVCSCATDGDCTVFEDQNLCTGTLTCDQSVGECTTIPSSGVACDVPDDPCFVATCNPATGTCFEHPAVDGSSCSDGSNCTLNDLCLGGECVGSGLESCEDNNPCTLDLCSPDGSCSHNALDSSCDDGNPCTVGDICTAGTCEPGSVNIGCVCSTDADCALLEDGNACNGTLSCQANVCATKPGTVVVCPGTGGSACATNTCSPLTGQCAVVSLPDGTGCTDLSACTFGDTCTDGLCKGTVLTCDDGNPCTADNCNPTAGCVFAMQDGSCDDDDPCTNGDTCVAGLCKGLTNVCECSADADCEDLNNDNLCVGEYLCTPTGCVPGPTVLCAPSANASGCVENLCDADDGVCKPKLAASGAACSDGDVCTTDDTCASGTCAGIEPGAGACADGNICTTNVCDPVLGCLSTPGSGNCSDGIACTTGDTCVAGTCTGAFTGCEDGNVCTTDSCAPSGCVHEANVLTCSDNNACTIDDECGSKVCVPGTLKDCNDSNNCTTDGICNPLTGECGTPIKLFLTPCDDGKACTNPDICTDGVCGSSSDDCDDDNVCTTDSCNPLVGCSNINNTSTCDDGELCTTDDTCLLGTCAGTFLDCDDDNPCTDDGCNGETCFTVDNVDPCTDLNLCTTADSCVDGECTGTTKVCDDSNACTTDLACAPATGNCPLPTPLTGPICDDGTCADGATCCCLIGVCTTEALPGFSCN